MQTNFKTQYQTIINAPVENVWKALTDADMVRQYFFGSNMVTDWKIGGPIFFRGEYEGTPYEDKGEVLEYAPNKKLRFSYLSSWSGMDDKPENYLEVSYEVKPVSGGTELTITQSNYNKEKADHSKENWKMVIDGMRTLVE
jgi:uncharacterized protein YndB with AHSA1/START domain